MEQEIKLFVFDLDGTLNRTDLFSVAAHQAVQAEMGWPVLSAGEICATFGEPAEQYMPRLLPGADRETARRYLTRVSEMEYEFLDHAASYQGCPQLLDLLHERGFRTAVCSNASLRYITMVLKAIGLDDRIDFLQPLEPGMHSKTESLRSLLERVKPSFAVMVGDTLLDCEAAQENGIPFIGCAYGFRPEEMKQVECAVAQPLDILTLSARLPRR